MTFQAYNKGAKPEGNGIQQALPDDVRQYTALLSFLACRGVRIA